MKHSPAIPKALIVDDNKDGAEMISQLLAFNGVDAQCVFGGLDAISEIKVSKPDVILLDIGMPSPNGYETLDAIRTLPECGNIPILALTAYSDSEHSARIGRTGFSCHLVKPCDFELLLSIVHRLADTGRGRATGDPPCTARADWLTEQRIEVALIYQSVRGTDDAAAYLASVDVPDAVVDRVLHSTARRAVHRPA